MSGDRRRTVDPRAPQTPLVIERSPELYNLFKPTIRRKVVITTETTTRSRRQQRVERSRSPPPPGHRTLPTMPPPTFVPLPPRIVQEPPPPHAEPGRQPQLIRQDPIVEQRAPMRRSATVYRYPHPTQAHETVIRTTPAPRPVSEDYGVRTTNQPVRSRQRDQEAQALAQARNEANRRSQDLESANRRIDELRRMLDAATVGGQQEARHAAQLREQLDQCQQEQRLLSRERSLESREREKAERESREANAALARERARNEELERERERQRQLQRQQEQEQQARRPAPNPRTVQVVVTGDPGYDAIRQAREDRQRSRGSGRGR